MSACYNNLTVNYLGINSVQSYLVVHYIILSVSDPKAAATAGRNTMGHNFQLIQIQEPTS